jgi:hypothetical protein
MPRAPVVDAATIAARELRVTGAVPDTRDRGSTPAVASEAADAWEQALASASAADQSGRTLRSCRKILRATISRQAAAVRAAPLTSQADR